MTVAGFSSAGVDLEGDFAAAGVGVAFGFSGGEAFSSIGCDLAGFGTGFSDGLCGSLGRALSTGSDLLFTFSFEDVFASAFGPGSAFGFSALLGASALGSSSAI